MNTDTSYVPMVWVNVLISTSLSVWRSGDYELHGHDRERGKKLPRDWTVLFKKDKLAQDVARMAQAKRIAERHAYGNRDNQITVVLSEDQVRAMSLAITHGYAVMRLGERDEVILEGKRVLDQALAGRDLSLRNAASIVE